MKNQLWGAAVELNNSVEVQDIEVIAVMAPSKVAAALKVAGYLKKCFSKKAAAQILHYWVENAEVASEDIVHHTFPRDLD